jgi:hypothetical protein
MASARAIGATTGAVRALLDRAAADLPATGRPSVETLNAAKLQTPPTSANGAVLSVWLHRVVPCAQRRSLPPRPRTDGKRGRPPIAVDLHYLISAWAGDPVVQHEALGWAIRVLDDHPSLAAPLLNDGGFANCFHPDETVDLVWDVLSSTEENEIWQVAQAARQPSGAYVARMIALESELPLPGAGDVLERDFEFAGAPA